MLKVAIIGVGAMGSLFAAKLTPLADVVMLGNWPEQLATLRTEGLTLVGPDGRSCHTPVRATNNPDDIGPVDVALILVKSRQTERAAAQAGQILAPDGVALTLQNGLGNLEKITAVMGPNRSALGVTAQAATMLAAGRVRHAGHGATHLAQTPPTAESLTAISALFQEAGLETHLIDEVDSLVWGKLAINTGVNPLTALLRVPNGFLAENEQARRVMGLAAEETAVVAHAQGIQLPYPDATQRALEVAQATASNHSSMLQDVLRGAPTEIEAICGAVVRYGRRYRVPTPINEQLLAFVKRVEAGDWEIGRLGDYEITITQSLNLLIS